MDFSGVDWNASCPGWLKDWVGGHDYRCGVTWEGSQAIYWIVPRSAP